MLPCRPIGVIVMSVSMLSVSLALLLPHLTNNLHWVV
jgi:hypothetical protein